MKKRIAFVIALLFSTFLDTSSAYAAQVTSGLLVDLHAANPSSYSGTGTNWIDLAGGDDNGTLTNGPVYDVSGGNGFINDGTNDYINIANRSALQPTTSACNTMMTWAKVISYANYDGIMGKMFAAYTYDGYALLMSGTNALTLKMNGNSIDQTVNSSSNAFTTNTWTLFTFVVCFGGSSSRQSLVYVNSSAVITANNSESSIGSPSAPIQIANGMQDGYEYGNIKVGAFAFYNRALTSQEIADSYSFYSNYVPDNTPPTITSSSSFTAAENQTSIGTLSANETSTWSLRSSADSATVNLNSSTGLLTFKLAPNFEAPTDSDLNNIYAVSVRATDQAGNSADMNLLITVTDVDESTSIQPSLSMEPKKGVSLEIQLVASRAGRVSVWIQGRRLNACSNRAISAPPSQLSCPWKPSVMGAQRVRITFTPSDSNYAQSTSEITALVTKRTTLR
jgi:hypothetical protein